jgi:hypothetical protein
MVYDTVQYSTVQFAVEIIGNREWGMQWRYPIEQYKKTEYTSTLQDR